MQDNDIVALYWARKECAITETQAKYGRYCHFIACRILENDADAEEIVNDTYLKLWNTIPPNRPEILRSYVGMICRQLSFNAFQAKNAQKRSGQTTLVLEELSECIPDGEGGADIGESLALRDALNKFLWSLPDKTRDIFLRRYWYSCPLSQIARAHGMTETHIRVLLFHTRNKLKKFLSKEDFPV